MSRFRTLIVASAASALVLTMAGCASDREETPATSGGPGASSPAASGEVPTGDGTFTFGAAGEPASFDPFYASDGETFRVTRQLYDQLLDFKPGTAELTEGLATKWEHSEDGLTWTFTLREGVKFSDGTDFNAEAVCKNFERWYDQNEASQQLYAASYWQDNFGGYKNSVGESPKESLYKSCEAKDPKTAIVTITRYTSKFPSILGHTAFAIQSPTAMDKYKANDIKIEGTAAVYPEYATKYPTGTGAFTLESYDTATKTITLKRNDSYWAGKPKVAKVVFRVISDETDRQQALKTGDIQAYDLPNPRHWEELKADGNKVEVRPAFNIFYIGLNAKANPALKDLKVRQALMYATNRAQLVTSQLPEGAAVATQFMPDTVAGYNKDLQAAAYDVEKAKSLLKEAGQENLTIKLWYPSEVSRPYMPDPQALFQAISADWKAAGINVEPVTKPWNGGYLTEVDQQLADAFFLGWTGDYNSADNFIGTFFGAANNRFGIGNYDWGQKLMDSLKEADSIPDDAQRTAKYQEINKAIMEEYLPAIPISHSPPALAIGPKVQGLVASPLTQEDFSTVYVP